MTWKQEKCGNTVVVEELKEHQLISEMEFYWKMLVTGMQQIGKILLKNMESLISQHRKFHGFDYFF